MSNGFSYLHDMEIGNDIISGCVLLYVKTRTFLLWHIFEVCKYDKRISNPNTFAISPLEARNEKLAEPRKAAREISWNFTFTALVDELMVSLFLNHEAKQNLSARKIWKRDGFVLMSGNEIVINYSKVKFVWFCFFYFSLISFCLLISKTKS